MSIMIRYRHTLHVAGIWAKVYEVFPDILAVNGRINVPAYRMIFIQIDSFEVLQLHKGFKDCVGFEMWFHIEYPTLPIVEV